MSFLKRQRRILDKIAENSGGRIKKKAEEKYKEIEESLSRLMDDVRNDSNFPKNAEEMLYNFSGEGGCNELALIKNLKETYALTKNGIEKYLELRLEGDMIKRAKVRTISSRELAFDHTDPYLFDQVCDNLQNIINKYRMKIDEKKYLIKI